MRTVEIFFSLGEHLVEDQRVRKYGAILVKNGVKGLKKANPTILWIDAGLSVIEAANSYLKYAKEKEITKQIRIENDAISQQLYRQLEVFRLQNIAQLAEGQLRIDELTKKIKLTNQNNLILIQEITSNLGITKRMLSLVKKERENNMNFEKLQKLQIALDSFIRTSLICLMNSTDDTEALVD